MQATQRVPLNRGPIVANELEGRLAAACHYMADPVLRVKVGQNTTTDAELVSTSLAPVGLLNKPGRPSIFQ